MTVTIRIRTSSGQHNFTVDPASLLRDFIAELAEHYSMPASKLAGRLYKDFEYKTPLLATNFAQSAEVKQYLVHGQLVYLRIAEDSSGTQEFATFEERVQKMNFTELQELVRHPDGDFVSNMCAHASNVYCMKCLAAWEALVLKTAGMSKLQYERERLRLASVSESESALQQNISNVRERTQDQLVLRYQGTPSVETLFLSESVGQVLQTFAYQHNFDVSMEAFLYGIGDKVLALTFPFFAPMQKQLILLYGGLYEEIYELERDIAKFNFGLDRVGTAYITTGHEFSAHELQQSMIRHDRFLLHAELVDTAHAVQKRENEFLERKFKESNGRPTRLQLLESTPNGMKVEAFELSEQAQFLYETGAVCQIQEPGFELCTNKKQIINNAFLDHIDTDCFIVNVGIREVPDPVNCTQRDGSVIQIRNTMNTTVYQELMFEHTQDMHLQDFAAKNASKADLRKTLVAELRNSQLSCIDDISFISATVFCGVLTRDEVVGKTRKAIEEALRDKL